MGDPTQPDVWKQLDAVLASEWETEEHHHLKIAQLAVDTGYCTHEVYAYVRERLPRGVVAIKGSSRRNAAAVGKGSKVDVNWKGRTIKKGVTLYMLGTDTIKTTLFGKLRLENGPGNLNFGLAADTEYFQQLTSERQKLVYREGCQRGFGSGKHQHGLSAWTARFTPMRLFSCISAVCPNSRCGKTCVRSWNQATIDR